MEKLRGCLNDELRQRAEQYLGRTFTQTELRLYPYLSYCCQNGARVERAKITDEEHKILKQLEDEGHIRRGYPSYLYPTRSFWAFMHDCLADSYVTLAEDLQ